MNNVLLKANVFLSKNLFKILFSLAFVDAISSFVSVRLTFRKWLFSGGGESLFGFFNPEYWRASIGYAGVLLYSLNVALFVCSLAGIFLGLRLGAAKIVEDRKEGRFLLFDVCAIATFILLIWFDLWLVYPHIRALN